MEPGYAIQADFKHGQELPPLQSSRAQTLNVPNHAHLCQIPFKYAQRERFEIRRQSWGLPHYLRAHEVFSTIRGGQRESQQEKTNRIYKPGLRGLSEPKRVNFIQPACRALSMPWRAPSEVLGGMSSRRDHLPSSSLCCTR